MEQFDELPETTSNTYVVYLEQSPDILDDLGLSMSYINDSCSLDRVSVWSRSIKVADKFNCRRLTNISNLRRKTSGKLATVQGSQHHFDQLVTPAGNVWVGIRASSIVRMHFTYLDPNLTEINISLEFV